MILIIRILVTILILIIILLAKEDKGKWRNEQRRYMQGVNHRIICQCISKSASLFCVVYLILLTCCIQLLSLFMLLFVVCRAVLSLAPLTANWETERGREAVSSNLGHARCKRHKTLLWCIAICRKTNQRRAVSKLFLLRVSITPELQNTTESVFK